MNTKLNVFGFCAGVLLAGSGFATTHMILADEPEPAKYNLPTNEEQKIVNKFGYRSEIACQFDKQDEQNKLFIRMVKGTTKINGLRVHEGQSMTLVVQPNTKFTIDFDRKGEIAVTNKDEQANSLTCTQN